MNACRLISLVIVPLIILFSNCSEDAEFISGYQGDRELEKSEEMPFLLGQNSPNPFNPSTTIPYIVAIKIHLKLTIYSDEWQPVQVLFESPTDPGSYEVEFDAEDLPSGDYYYVLEGGDYTQIRKMKLVK